ncbi:hypothetical protein BB559_002320 [Furculomyces boomerangus]|uniref:Inosine/uridine-preferring nucleoside hydrolase domain-containing protein n=2 Tax=Harpellales TaxID=61421 RepID=A0A2T9YWD3_9FUNG|nr:hypothetical protein BB559_002320 [Furculomyces boomerangus]PWA03639.1 hypothetical protein BB558_000162 [Smittium angustum]
MSTRVSRIPMWVDCDPGHDDAMAIILAAYHPEINLLGISTVSGNQSVQKTTANAISMLESIGRTEIPVVMGASKPLLRFLQHDAEIHGESGLDGTKLLPKCNQELYEKSKQGKKAITVIYEAIMASSEPVSLIALGTLTNIALLVSVYPEVVKKVKVFSFMGGAISVGNRSAVAEFNIMCDPEAAQIVMNAGFEHMAMVPLDVTHTALVTPTVLEMIKSRVGKVNANFSTMVCELLMFFRDSYKNTFGFNEGPPLHDPLAVFYVVAREAFEEKLMRVDVECGEGMCAGQTVCDIWNYSAKPKNCYVTSKVDLEKFWNALVDSMAKAATVSPL